MQMRMQGVPASSPFPMGSSRQESSEQLYCTEAIYLDPRKDLIYSGNLSSKDLPWRKEPVKENNLLCAWIMP